MTDTGPARRADHPQMPGQKYTLRIIDESGREHVLEVDPDRIPYSGHGQPGSVLDIACGHGVKLDHACGGVCACATCHVIVREGLESCSAAGEEEEDQLDQAYGLTGQSRLACQCVPDGTRTVLVEIPSWNRNLARESH